MSAFILLDSESSEASDFFRLLKKDGGRIGDQAHREMSDSHLISDGSHLVVSSLLGFAITEAREVAFDLRAHVVCVLKESRVSGNTRTSVIGDIEILGATVCDTFAEARVRYRTTVRVLCSEGDRCFERATELGTATEVFGPCTA